MLIATGGGVNDDDDGNNGNDGDDFHNLPDCISMPQD